MARHPDPAARRVADVHLRGAAPRGPARAYWPADGAPRPPLVVVLAPPPAADPALVDRLLERVGAVVLVVPATLVAEAHATLAWAADHGRDLGADPDRLAVVGVGSGAALAERVVALAAAEGWPPLRQVVLIWPLDDPGAALDRLAGALAGPAGPVR